MLIQVLLLTIVLLPYRWVETAETLAATWPPLPRAGRMEFCCSHMAAKIGTRGISRLAQGGSHRFGISKRPDYWFFSSSFFFSVPLLLPREDLAPGVIRLFDY